MLHIIAAVFIGLLAFTLLLNALSLPANWIILIFCVLWTWLHPNPGLTWTYILLLFGLAFIAESLEFVLQYYGGKKFGSTGKGNLGGIIGAIAGSILCAPFLFGLGAIPGALGGAFLGCMLLELGQGRSMQDSKRAAWGALWGKFFGMTLKFALGAAMLGIAAYQLWPA